MNIERLTENLSAARHRIADAADAAGRDPAEIRLLLAVKTQPVEAIRAVVDAGVDLLGHNRAQELVATGPALAEPGVPAHEMHFIGHLQSNKIKQVLRWASCVQTVDTLRLAEKLDRALARHVTAAADASSPAAAASPREPLDVMIQVNTSAEPTKAGVDPAGALDLAVAVGALPHLRLRGLMTIGANSTDHTRIEASYAVLARLRDAVLESGAPGTDQAYDLSMGMSGDLEIAVATGATMVRLGTAVFGARPA